MNGKREEPPTGHIARLIAMIEDRDEDHVIGE